MHIVGVDPNPEMASYAVQAAQDANLPQQALQLLNGTAEQLPVPSTSQDAVVCTLVSVVALCTQTCIDLHSLMLFALVSTAVGGPCCEQSHNCFTM